MTWRSAGIDSGGCGCRGGWCDRRRRGGAREAFVELLPELSHLLSVAGQLLLLPAVGHSPQECDQGRRGCQDHALVHAFFDELTIPLSVPFDAGGTYVRAPTFDVGGFKAYRSQGSLRDFVAVHDVSASGESQVVSVGSTSYASTGFRGTSVTS